MKQKELNEILRLHEMWLNDEEGGKYADLRHADLQNSDLRCADLRNSDLRGANLEHSDLRGADLSDANLRCADLRNSDLRRADLRHADILDTDLRNSDLQYAKLQDADLRNSDLRGVVWDFSCFPLWCGGAYFKTDVKLLRQLAAHMCTLECDDEEWLALKEAILPFAKKSHRAEDLGLIDKEEEWKKRN